MAIKKSSRKQATPMRRSSSGGSGWMTGLLIGLIIGGLAVFYLLAIQPKIQTLSPTTTTPEPKTAADIKKDDTDKKKSSSPRFDFYKLLPENASTNNNSNSKPIAASPAPSTTISPTPASSSAFDSDADMNAKPTTSSTTTSTTTGTPVETHAATTDSKIPSNYLLQAGSFHSAPDADKVRANIILLGLPSRVESVKNDKGETFYRVYVGSFASEDAMKNAQATLTKNKINAVTVKPK